MVPDPLAYAASRSLLPVSRSKVGAPVTVTAPLKVTWIEILAPGVYGPSAVDEVTPVTFAITKLETAIKKKLTKPDKIYLAKPT